MLPKTPKTQAERPLLAGVVLVGLVSAVVGFAGPQRAEALEVEDAQLLNYLIAELRYFDTAQRHIDDLRGARRNDPDLDSLAIDLLRASGKDKEALRALEAFKKKYPGHSRAALGSLEQIAAAYKEVGTLLEKAAILSDPAARKTAFSKANKLFNDTVRQPIDATIAAFEDAFSKVDIKDPKRDEAEERRDRAELSRLNFLLLFATALPEGSKTRSKTLEEGLSFASAFVENRGSFFVMQYDAQVRKGLFLTELARYDEAAEEISVLYDIEPPAAPPYPASITAAFKNIRLKSLLYGIRALNSGGKHEAAAQTYEDHILNQPADSPFPFAGAEKDPGLKGFAVLAKLEYGIALAGSNRPREGLDTIHGIISKYETGSDAGYVIDARRALGRISQSGSVALSGRDLYQAGQGLMSELKIDDAVVAFQSALARLSPSDSSTIGPLCLKQIGEILYARGQFIEAAGVFSEMALYFPGSELSQKGANNLIASINEARKPAPDHAGLLELKSEAEKLDTGGNSTVVEQAKLADADRAINSGDYAKARKIYETVPAENKGGKIPFYWRAQFSAHWMVILEHDYSNDDARRAELSAEFEKSIEYLDTNLQTAIDSGDTYGAAIGALTLGQMRVARGENKEAVQVLKAFLGELGKEDATIACQGLSFLVDAATATNDASMATLAFKGISKGCRDTAVFGYTALTMAEFFRASSGSSAAQKAAAYMQVYAESPKFQKDIAGLEPEQKANAYLNIARALVDGGAVGDAQAYIKKAEATAGKGELKRQLLYLDALAKEQQKNHAQVITTLKAYIKDYKARGEFFEDPYVWRKLGFAYYRYGKAQSKSEKKKTIATALLVKADQALNNARSILGRALRAQKDPSPALDRQYWQWAYEWLQVKNMLGRKDATAYKEIVFFVNEWKHTPMGGRLDKFLALQKSAQSRARKK